MTDDNAQGGNAAETNQEAVRAPDYERMARTMVFQSMLDHPLPWRIEPDWTHEVSASDGHIIAKCESPDEAQAIIDFAGRIQAELVAAEDWFAAMMAG